jgi:hypothetical protein
VLIRAYGYTFHHFNFVTHPLLALIRSRMPPKKKAAPKSPAAAASTQNVAIKLDAATEELLARTDPWYAQLSVYASGSQPSFHLRDKTVLADTMKAIDRGACVSNPQLFAPFSPTMDLWLAREAGSRNMDLRPRGHPSWAEFTADFNASFLSDFPTDELLHRIFGCLVPMALAQRKQGTTNLSITNLSSGGVNALAGHPLSQIPAHIDTPGPQEASVLQYRADLSTALTRLSDNVIEAARAATVNGRIDCDGGPPVWMRRAVADTTAAAETDAERNRRMIAAGFTRERREELARALGASAADAGRGAAVAFAAATGGDQSWRHGRGRVKATMNQNDFTEISTLADLIEFAGVHMGPDGRVHSSYTDTVGADPAAAGAGMGADADNADANPAAAAAAAATAVAAGVGAGVGPLHHDDIGNYSDDNGDHDDGAAVAASSEAAAPGMLGSTRSQFSAVERARQATNRIAVQERLTAGNADRIAARRARRAGDMSELHEEMKKRVRTAHEYRYSGGRYGYSGGGDDEDEDLEDQVADMVWRRDDCTVM